MCIILKNLFPPIAVLRWHHQKQTPKKAMFIHVEWLWEMEKQRWFDESGGGGGVDCAGDFVSCCRQWKPSSPSLRLPCDRLCEKVTLGGPADTQEDPV